MPRIKYQDIDFGPARRLAIQRVNAIIAEVFAPHGIDPTLRQVYYKFVARNWIENKEQEYKKLGDIIAQGRLTGLIDWNSIVDRLRTVNGDNHWESPGAIIQACAKQFRYDKWDDQPEYVEVWVEKDGMISTIASVCQERDVPYMACKGYASVSAMWDAGHNRLRQKLMADRQVTVLYLGDHDPSGVDMTRDIQARLRLFSDCESSRQVNVERLALNMDQVELYQPPENPTKVTDSRAAKYIEEYGHSCWELDALDVVVIRDLIANAIDHHMDEALFRQAVRREAQARADLALVADNWQDAVAAVKDA